MSSSTKAVSNTIFLTLDWISISLLSFIYSFVIWKTLDPWDYGIITTSVNIMMMLGNISMFGMGIAAQKLIAEYNEKKQGGKIGSLIRFSLILIFIFDIFICAVLLLNSNFFASVLKIDESVIWFICAGTFIFSVFYITSSILLGFQDMKGFFKTNLVGNILKLVISTTLILLGLRYFGPLAGVVIGFAVVPLIRFKRNWFGSSKDFERKKVVIDYCLPAFVAGLASTVFSNVHYIILTVIKNPEVTGLFSLAMTVATLVALVPGIISQAIFPITSQLSARKNSKGRQVKLVGTAFRYSLLIAIPFAIMLVIMLKPLILFIKLKMEYLPAVQYMPILATGSLLLGCGGIFSSSIYAIGKTRVNRNIFVLSAIVFLLFSIPMTYFFSAYGLAFSFLLVAALQFTLSYFFITKYTSLKLPLANIGKILLSSLIFMLVLYFSEKYFESFILKVSVTAVSFAVYAVALLLMKSFNGQDILLIRHIAENSPKPVKDAAELACRIMEKFM